jgi:exopolysaccharide production protein ExoZ
MFGWLAARFESPLSRGRILEMEGLRGAAVILVFFVHFGTLLATDAGRYTSTFSCLRRAGNSGVDLFFLLSGYLIYGILLSKPISFASFWRRRAQRIYPAFGALFAAYLLFGILVPTYSKVPQGTGPGLLYLAKNALLLPGIFEFSPMIAVAWTLSYEFFSYLIFPVVIQLVGMRTWRPRSRVYFWIGCALAFVAFTFATHSTYIPALALRPGRHIRLLMFIGGPLLYEHLHSGAWRLRRRHEPAIVLACVVAPILLWSNPGGPVFDIVHGVSLLLVFGCVVDFSLTTGGACGAVLRWMPLRWLGNMSYSFYLAHGTLLLALQRAFARAGWRPGEHSIVFLVLPLSFGLATLTAAMLYLAVERPYSILPGPTRPAPDAQLQTAIIAEETV